MKNDQTTIAQLPNRIVITLSLPFCVCSAKTVFQTENSEKPSARENFLIGQKDDSENSDERSEAKR